MKTKQSLGTIIKELIAFSMPLIFSGMLQQLYNWADAFIVGNVSGELSLSAIGVTTIPINFFITTITGFTLGLSVLIAKNFGAGKKENIPPFMAVFAVLLGGIFMVVAAVGSVLSYPFMALLDTPSETINFASSYIRIVFLGLPFLAVYNVYTATMRGLGDSRVPFLSILLSSIVNVLLDILFVAKLGLGVQGAATATVLSQATMTIFVIIYGTRKYRWLKSGYRKENFCAAVVEEGVQFGFPPMIQSCVSSMGGLVLQNYMNGFGMDTVTAITTAYRIDTLIMLPIVNLGSGISTLTAQSYGAKNKTRTTRIFTAGILLASIVSLILTGIVIPTGGKMIALFGAGTNAVMIGNAFFHRIAYFYPIFGLGMALRGYLEGIGALTFSSIAGIASLGIRIIASYMMAPYFSNMSIAYAEMLAWMCLLVMYLVRFWRIRGNWHK